MSVFIGNTAKYAIYVKVLAGQGDGPLIIQTADGKIIHVGPGDPSPQQNHAFEAAIRQINAGVEAFYAAGR